MALVFRLVKGSGLTNAEIDENFRYLEPIAQTQGDGFTVDDTDSNDTILVDPAGGSFTINLTAAATLTANFRVSIINIGATGTVTIDPSGAETINGAATLELTNQYDTVTLQSTGTTWYVVSESFAADVTSTAVITDNVLVRGDGGVRGVQETGITVADTTNNISGVGTIGSGAITATGVVTATGFTIGSAVIDETDLEKIDDITNGTAAANKAVVLDASTNITGIGTIGSGAITSSGAVQGTSLTDGTATITGGTVTGTSITDGTATMTGGAITGLTTPLTAAQGGTGNTFGTGIIAIKAADTSKTNDTVLADDPHLTFSLEASSTYIVEGFIDALAASSTPDIRLQWNEAGGGTADMVITGRIAITLVGTTIVESASNALSLGTISNKFTISGVIVTSGAGTSALQWAQDTSSADFTRLLANSWIRLTKIA